jgi:hypothetical protein
MKLVFTRNPDNSLNVIIKKDDQTENFSYSFFIDELYKNSQLEESEFPENITQIEKDKILDMITRINQIVAANRMPPPETS